MAVPYFHVIAGKYVIIGKEPDGDSVRFIADNPGIYHLLQGGYRIKPSADGSVQLRFEGVDAPELHYGSAAQPLGAEARDQLLNWMGFKDIHYESATSTKVVSAQPASIPGVILSKAADIHGRPIAYALLHDAASSLPHKEWVLVDQHLLDLTLNVRLLQAGMAYYLGYTSIPYAHRQHLVKIAAAAREARQGVWAKDSTSDFQLLNQHSIDPTGQLIFPKLFRRCTDYLKAVDRGFKGNLMDWLIWVSKGSRDENDRVLIHNSIEVHLSDLLKQRNSHVVFQANLLDITFIEK